MINVMPRTRSIEECPSWTIIPRALAVIWGITIFCAPCDAAKPDRTRDSERVEIAPGRFQVTLQSGMNYQSDTGEWNRTDCDLEDSGGKGYKPKGVGYKANIGDSSKYGEQSVVSFSVGGVDIDFYPVGKHAGQGAKKNGNKMDFDGTWNGIDIEFQTTPDGIKENITIQSGAGLTWLRKREIKFQFRASESISIETTATGAVIKAEDGRELIALPNPTLTNVAPVQVPQMAYLIESGPLGPILVYDTMQVKGWLLDTALPIVIDPTITLDTTGNYGDNWAGYSVDPVTAAGSAVDNWGGADFMMVGQGDYPAVDGSGYYQANSFIVFYEFDTQIPAGVIIDSAQLLLDTVPNYKGTPPEANDTFVSSLITDTWLAGTNSGSPQTGSMDWAYRINNTVFWDSFTSGQPGISGNAVNGGGDFYTSPISEQIVDTANGSIAFNVTSLCQEWSDSTRVNNGFLIRPKQFVDTCVAMVRFRTREAVQDRPLLTVTYHAADTIPPDSFTLLVPVQGAETNTRRITFTWSASSDSVGLDTYRVRVSSDPTFTATDTDCTVVYTTTQYTAVIESDSNCTYYWRVTAYDTQGNSRTEGDSSFVYDTVLPGASTLTSPTASETIYSQTHTFTWSAATETQTGFTYRLIIAQDSGCTVSVAIDSPGLTSASVVEKLPQDTAWYWRIVTTDGATNQDTSAVGKFYTATAVSLEAPTVRPSMLYRRDLRAWLIRRLF